MLNRGILLPEGADRWTDLDQLKLHSVFFPAVYPQHLIKPPAADAGFPRTLDP